MIIVEVDLDEQGRVKALRLRKKLEDSLDQAVLEGLKRALFAPAMLAGRAVPSTLFWRTRFELER